MSIKVLVFESDAAFAGELRSELGKLGCSTCVVDDGTVGLQQASAERPDLILLSIELPRMNGFSVCNKLKKDVALKNVPLIIMSSESSDETFEQHRKLRTRAEDYVHKPIAFGELLQHIRTFVAMDDPVNDTSDVDSIVIDDEISVRAPIPDLDEGTVIGPRPVLPPPSHAPPRHIDADIDAFTESAFGRLQEPARSEPSARPPPAEQLNGAHDVVGRAPPGMAPAGAPAGARQSFRPAQPPPVVDDGERARLAGELERAQARIDELEKEVAASNERLAHAREDADAEGERKQREIDDLRARAQAPAKAAGGGVSTREFLDLREALNKKDKEILALKESVSSRDREIFESRDKSLAVERSLAEVEEKILAREREIAELREKNDEVGDRLDGAQSSLRDLQGRFDKTSADLDSTREKLETEQVARKTEGAAHDENEAKLRDELAQAAAAAAQAESRHRLEGEAAASQHKAELEASDERHERAVAELTRGGEEAVAKAKAEGEAQRAQAVAAREKELRAETDSKLAALHRAHQEELSRLRADSAQQLEATKRDAEARFAAEKTRAAQELAAKEEELDKKHSDAMAEAQAAAQSRIQEIEEKAESEVAEAKAKSEAEVAEAKAKSEAEVAEARAKSETEVAEARAKSEAEVAEAKAKSEAEVAEAKAKSATEVAEANDRREAEVAEANDKREAEVAEANDKAEASLADAKAKAQAELAQVRESFEAQLANAQANAAMAHETATELGHKLDETNKDLGELGAAKQAGDAASAAKIADLEERLRKVESARDVLEHEGTEAKDRIAALESQLGAESGRLKRAIAKWDADKGTLERAKDALAVALSQIDEVEARPIDSYGSEA